MKNFVVQTVSKGVKTSLAVPGSKSLSNRALLISALAEGKSQIHNCLRSDDTDVMIKALKLLGVRITQKKDIIEVQGLGGRFRKPAQNIDIHNAGTAMRFLTAALAATGTNAVLSGDTRMCQRPIADLVNALNNQGAIIIYGQKNGYPPLKITGESQLSGGETAIKGNLSSQYLSALLMAAPFAKKPLKIKVKGPLVSASYIDLTLQIMRDFGIKCQNSNNREFFIDKEKYLPRKYVVEADASSASYFFAIAALNEGKITVKNLRRDSLQGDIHFLDVLEKMGCRIEENANGICATGPKKLKPLGTINLNHMPDSAMTVAILAAATNGESELTHLGNLRIKETDRLAALSHELQKIGISAKETVKGLKIIGQPQKIKPAPINTYRDHRMAMCFAVLGTRFPGISILDPDCVNKTYPDFWRDLNKIYE